MLRALADPLLRYGGAVAAVVVAAALTALLWPSLQTTINTVFVAAVTVAAWYGGLGPGALATVLSALAIDYYFEAPYYHISFAARDVVRDLVFVGVALLISALNSRRQRAEQRLRKRRLCSSTACTSAPGTWSVVSARRAPWSRWGRPSPPRSSCSRS